MTNEKFRLTRKSGKIVSMISATSLLVGTFFGCSSSNSMNSVYMSIEKLPKYQLKSWQLPIGAAA